MIRFVHRPALVLSTILAVSLSAFATEPPREVDVVVCLDTSGSMEELIDAARARLWDVVSELSRLQPTPRLRVGLIAYGTDRGTESGGWIVEESDLSGDLDGVYGRLMELEVGGGDELVGQTLKQAVETMSWSSQPDALKVIFIAGNESARQGGEDPEAASRLAQERGIFVNALFAGNRHQAMVESWPALASGGGGTFANIDPSLADIQISTAQDEPLLELNRRLNETYLPYGSDGATGLANQVAQDAGASVLGVQSCSSRIAVKGTKLYSNAGWDLIDRSSEPGFEWSQLEDEDLPVNVRYLADESRDALIAELRGKREAIQEEIRALSDLREIVLREAYRAELGAIGLDQAMRSALADQASQRGFMSDEDC